MSNKTKWLRLNRVAGWGDHFELGKKRLSKILEKSNIFDVKVNDTVFTSCIIRLDTVKTERGCSLAGGYVYEETIQAISPKGFVVLSIGDGVYMRYS